MSGYETELERGYVALNGERAGVSSVEDREWHPHPVLDGVALKHLLTGEDTGGRMSLHLVRIEAGCAIAAHTHETNWELHQVVGGSGECLTCGESMEYRPGVQASLQNGVAHEVRAGAQGLRLLATFAPPLL